MTTIAWNVDTQYDFMRPDGKLYIKDAEKIEPTLEKLTQLFKKHGTVVVNTADWHAPENREISETPDFKTTFPEHCMEGSPGAGYVPATTPEKPYVIGCQARYFEADRVKSIRNIVLHKNAFDVFSGNKHANAVISALNPERVIVYGVATNVCVNFAVHGLLDRKKEVVVVTDAIKELPGLPLEEILDGWATRGVYFTTAAEVEQYLVRP